MKWTDAAKRYLPEWLFVPAIRANRAWQAPPHEARGRRLYAQLGSPTTVAAGPFAGMAYLPEATGSQLAPKLLGTYELELHAAVEAMIARQPDVIVDVGAAEGYYAVGLARRVPGARVVAFDTDRFARILLGRMRAANAMGDRVEVAGLCTPADLQAALAPAVRPAVVCDCEGFEDQLLDPAAVPALRRTDVLVEVHEGMAPGVDDRLRARFAGTHRIDVLPTRPRLPADCTVDTTLSPDDLAAALNEYRTGTLGWFHMVPVGNE